jgi:hypothetical protein
VSGSSHKIGEQKEEEKREREERRRKEEKTYPTSTLLEFKN